jgi:cellulose synthase/poly-beta-1,6-N-acetylglucosamine synthase-like glycosyltransferase
VAVAAILAAPQQGLPVLSAVFIGIFLASALIRLAAILTPRRLNDILPLGDDALPSYTIIAPLYREAEVAAELVANLNRLDYPRDRLQVLIALEADDLATQAAFAGLVLPDHLQVLVVADGHPKTKPRACNLALAQATGAHVVIYDAEDAPHPGQLREAAARFAAGPPDLACLQAPLRIETPVYLAFIAEQFRLEYAALFEVLLPAFARWGLPFPLGGTSNHFKIAALRAVGGWDPYNVTEDADIGFRLAAAGYSLDTATLPTLETAPTRLGQWGPQRARWIKGHLQTLVCHGRLGPRLGLRTFIALLVTLAVPVAASNLHAPAMLIALLAMLEDWHGDGILSIPIAHLVFYAGCWAICAIGGALGVLRSGGKPRFLHLFGLVPYWLMWILASPRALWQFFFAPHHWDKTQHAPRAGRHAS